MGAREPILDMFVFETMEITEQLQQLMLLGEKTREISQNAINEIFRIMHTIKGSSGMMMFDNISHLAHSMEDMFYFIRENKIEKLDVTSLADLVLEGGDLIREETERIHQGHEADTDFTYFTEKVQAYLKALKRENGFLEINDPSTVRFRYYRAVVFFEQNCQMENIRGFTVIHKLKEISEILSYEPEDILNEETSVEIVRNQGIRICFKTLKPKDEIRKFFDEIIFLEKLDLEEFLDEETLKKHFIAGAPVLETVRNEPAAHTDIHEDTKKEMKESCKSSLISVDVRKLDKLMDLVGELVISESMVANNVCLKAVMENDLQKAIRQHGKRISDLQDVVMSIRMVSLSPTLNKMRRIVRDMCKKLNKKAELKIIGENTEVDKNIIEHIGDPLMHIVRNSMDHGIEPEEDRKAAGKNPVGQITIEAKNQGGDVRINIIDDGKGLNREKIQKKAIENGIITGDGNDLSDKEIYATIFSPGLSTKEQVTEFSGRGVGMDVVVKEIEKVRGTVNADSREGLGTTISIKIPLTIAILEGMIIRVGSSVFTIPVTSVRQSMIVKKEDVFKDLGQKEMILIRGACFSILRLYELYHIETDCMQIEEGILIMVEDDGKAICIFADELLGEQQIVIKALPEAINKVRGASGCTLLGNGCISLILDVSQLVNM